MTETKYYLNDIPIIITTYKTKVRHHKKRRIQKKWAKQQLIFELQHDGEVVLANGCYYMNENTINSIRDRCKAESEDKRTEERTKTHECDSDEHETHGERTDNKEESEDKA